MEIIVNTPTDTATILSANARTQAFSITNSAAMANLLSTSLYSNPLRAAMRELICNAWDSHVASGRTDTPIDISVHYLTGVTVADHGSGIAHDMVHDIYCTYGSSTKTSDANQTGGFGLGSKSPFAIADTFTVTSHYDGKKSLYLMEKASEQAMGMPAATRLSSTPTTNTGLTVNVALMGAYASHSTAYDVICNILKHSGIRAILTYTVKEGTPPRVEEIYSPAPEVGSFLVTESNAPKGGVLCYASYGRVKYPVPTRDSLRKEFPIFSSLANSMTMLVGFASGSLSVMPSREGLHFSPYTDENIQLTLKAIETALEKDLMVMFERYTKNYFNTYSVLDYGVAVVVEAFLTTLKFRSRSPTNVGHLTQEIRPELTWMKVYELSTILKSKDQLRILFNVLMGKYPQFTEAFTDCYLVGVNFAGYSEFQDVIKAVQEHFPTTHNTNFLEVLKAHPTTSPRIIGGGRLLPLDTRNLDKLNLRAVIVASSQSHALQGEYTHSDDFIFNEYKYIPWLASVNNVHRILALMPVLICPKSFEREKLIADLEGRNFFVIQPDKIERMPSEPKEARPTFYQCNPHAGSDAFYLRSNETNPKYYIHVRGKNNLLDAELRMIPNAFLSRFMAYTEDPIVAVRTKAAIEEAKAVGAKSLVEGLEDAIRRYIDLIPEEKRLVQFTAIARCKGLANSFEELDPESFLGRLLSRNNLVILDASTDLGRLAILMYHINNMLPTSFHIDLALRDELHKDLSSDEARQQFSQIHHTLSLAKQAQGSELLYHFDDTKRQKLTNLFEAFFDSCLTL